MHLARCANGPEPLASFLDSYTANTAGIDHQLVVVLKGYASKPHAADLARSMLPSDAHVLHVQDFGFDLDAYRAAWEKFEYSHYCFMNSFSTVSAPNWLAMLLHWAEHSGVGIAGSTGSYESLRTDEIRTILDIVRYPRHLWSMPEHVRAYLPKAAGRLWRATRDFGPFPNPHIRTNAFLLSKHILDRLAWPPLKTKHDAHCLESGRRGITAQILRWGLEPVVVGRDGEGYFRGRWHVSGTFWQDNQHNLLVEDNQTRGYQAASEAERQLARRRAWGCVSDRVMSLQA